MKTLQTRVGSIVLLALLVSVSACNRDTDMAQMREMAEHGEKAFKQYRTADYPTAKAALLEYLRYLNGKLEDPSFDQLETAKIEMMLSYGRLAKLEEKNNGPEKDAYVRQALAICQNSEVKRDCSEEGLRGEVDAHDLMGN